MFQAFSTAMQSALAPEVPLVVDFKHHWNHFLRFYADRRPKDYRSQPVEKTNLVFHLNRMLKILIDEQQSNREDTSMGPCMEYLVNHQILDVLSTLCQADIPPGLRPYIFNLFLFLLTKINQNILPYVSVYLPIRRLLMLCSVTKASPTESQELNLITALTTKLRDDPNLVSLFAHNTKTGNSVTSSRRSSTASSMIDLSHIEKIASSPACTTILLDFNSQHLVVSALINYVDSADYIVSCKAMDSLLHVCALPDKAAALDAVQGTRMKEVITQRLVSLFNAIPTDVDPTAVEAIQVNWMEAHHMHSTQSNVADFHGKCELVGFFSWLDFCDNLVKTSDELISDSLAFEIRENFLDSCLDIKHEITDDVVKCTLLLAEITQCWIHIHSEGLAAQFSSWLLGDHTDPDGVIEHPMKRTMIGLCRSKQPEISLESLRLFDILLERPCQPILDGLVLRNLELRGYYNHGLAESTMQSWSDEEDERERMRSPCSDTRSFRRTPSRTLAPSNIHRVVNAWLFLVPDELRSSGEDAKAASGYEQYVSNAHIQVADMMEKCECFRWPREATFTSEPSETSSSDSRPEAETMFFEGEFLAMVFDLVESILEQDYDVNLQLTAILSKLALLPHPFLHEFLLNPTIPVSPGTRTLFGSMTLVLEKAKALEIEQLQRKIYLCRKSLLGGSASERLQMNITKQETKAIEGLIVLEEFSKEMAAITFSKYNHSAC